MDQKKSKLERINRLYSKLINGKPEPIHFAPDKLPTTIDEALELFQKHNPDWWDDKSLKWYKDRVRSELIDGNKFVLDVGMNGEHKYMVGMFDETFENMMRQTDGMHKSNFYYDVAEAIKSLQSDCAWED